MQTVEYPPYDATATKYMQTFLDMTCPDKKPTPREAEVAWYIVNGVNNGQIADIMTVSVKTVEAHRAHLLTKVKPPYRGRYGLVRYYWELIGRIEASEFISQLYERITEVGGCEHEGAWYSFKDHAHCSECGYCGNHNTVCFLNNRDTCRYAVEARGEVFHYPDLFQRAPGGRAVLDPIAKIGPA